MDGASRPATRPDRPAVSLPCTVRFGEIEVAARLVDIGYGGVGLALPETGDAIDAGMIFEVQIDGIGPVEVECRWRRGDRIGAQFIDEDAVQTLVEAFLAARRITAS